MAIVRQAAVVVREVALGVPCTSPVPGTDSIVIRLPDGDSQSVRQNPVMLHIPAGGGMAGVVAQSISDHSEVKGALKTRLYGSQMAFLLGWACLPINSGLTTPWATNGPTGTPPGDPVGDLASASVYHLVQYSDGSYKRQRYAGCKVAKLVLDATRDKTEVGVSIDLVGQRVVGDPLDSSSDPLSSEFPTPADAAYPTDPMVFRYAAGNLTIGSARTMFGSVMLTVENMLDQKPYESYFAQVIRNLGRKITLQSQGLLKSSPNDRSSYESVATLPVSFGMSNGLTGGAGHAFTANLNGNNVITAIDDSLDDSKLYEAKLTTQTNWDAAAGADMTLTVS